MTKNNSELSSKSSYSTILKSSAQIGVSQVLVIAIGIIRAKVMAILLGPAGFGLMGLYQSIVDLAASAGGMGVGSSGVRQIAAAAGSDDRTKIAQTVTALRSTSLVLGGLGAALLAVFAKQVSTLTFGDTTHTWAIIFVAAAVFFRIVTAGQNALIQGLRRVSDLAVMNSR